MIQTIVVIPNDAVWEFGTKDPQLGEKIARAMRERKDKNISTQPNDLYGVQLGPQFHSNDTLFVSIEDGVIKRLSPEEQNHLRLCLARYRRKKEDDAND